MKPLIISLAVIMLGTTNANALSIGDCNTLGEDTFDITGGTQTVTSCRYVFPNCRDGCLCCMVSPSYSCDCDTGYYNVTTNRDNGDCSCEKCPANTASCSSSTSFTCVAGYYKNGTTCSPCPTPGTSAQGATEISNCYLPSGTKFDESAGDGYYASDCNYTP